METYFLSESQIQLWLDQLIEKIITVSQLEETQSEYALEFENGRKLVEEITGLLTNISLLPPSSVSDPIINLIEQRLQGQKIVDLSSFNKVMGAIVSKGIAVASGKLDIEPQAIPALAATVNQNLTKDLQLTPTLKEQFNTNENEPQQKCESQLNIQQELPLARNENNPSLIPLEAASLAFVIKQIFPNSQIQWNFCLKEYNFLVQVENLLIYQEALNEGEIVRKEMKNEGWNILVCKKEDLSFPRRFKREIKRILKNTKI